MVKISSTYAAGMQIYPSSGRWFVSTPRIDRSHMGLFFRVPVEQDERYNYYHLFAPGEFNRMVIVGAWRERRKATRTK